MISTELKNLIETYIIENGEDSLISTLKKNISNNSNGIITIIVNQGLHHFPDALIKGEKYICSHGSFNIDDIKTHIEQTLSDLAKKLKSERWRKIYLVPSGHPLLSMQVKLLIFRITRMESIDIGYFGEGGYKEFVLAQRPIIETA